MTEVDSNYREDDDLSVRGLQTIEQAESIRELLQRGIDQDKQGEDYCLRVDTRDDGMFDLIVLKRIN